MDEVVSGDLRDVSILSRKRNLLLFFIVLTFISISPMSIAGTTLWDIQPNVFFRGSGDGPISLNAAGTASQIRIVSGVVEFTSLTIGSSSISFIGFNASSNANVTAVFVGNDRAVYNIEANNGVTTTTVVKAPPGRDVSDVSGGDSFSFDGSTDLVTVTEVHGATTKQIIVFFNPVSLSFSQTISALADILMLVGVLVGFMIVGAVAKGEFFSQASFALIGFIIVTAVAIIILRIGEALFN